jgi:Na+/H+ antiporter NhaD/arsenite permease-like protein
MAEPVPAMSCPIAGSLPIPGSIAELIVIEGARRRGVAITSQDCPPVDAPLTMATLAFGASCLSMR